MDTLLLYDDKADVPTLNRAVEKLSREGSVLAQRAVPEKLKYRRLVRLEEVDCHD